MKQITTNIIFTILLLSMIACMFMMWPSISESSEPFVIDMSDVLDDDMLVADDTYYVETISINTDGTGKYYLKPEVPNENVYKAKPGKPGYLPHWGPKPTEPHVNTLIVGDKKHTWI